MLLLPSNLLVLHFWIQPTVDQNIKKKIPETPPKQELESAVYQQLFGLPRWRQCKEPTCQC